MLKGERRFSNSPIYVLFERTSKMQAEAFQIFEKALPVLKVFNFKDFYGKLAPLNSTYFYWCCKECVTSYRLKQKMLIVCNFWSVLCQIMEL